MDGLSPIDNFEDILDSRDIIARIEYLTELGTPEDVEPGENEFTGLDQEEANELEALRRLASEAEDYAPDWHYGEALIRDSYFVTYAQELVEECYDLGDLPGFIYVDWERTARDVRMDYTAVDFDGVTYWIR